MKTTRKNTFETNSSSYHTLTLGRRENSKKFNLISIVDGVMTINLLAEPASHRNFNTFEEKIYYAFYSLLRQMNDDSHLKELLEIGNDSKTFNFFILDENAQKLLNFLQKKYPETSSIQIAFPLEWWDIYGAIDFGEGNDDPLFFCYGKDTWGGIEFLEDDKAYIYEEG